MLVRKKLLFHHARGVFQLGTEPDECECNKLELMHPGVPKTACDATTRSKSVLTSGMQHEDLYRSLAQLSQKLWKNTLVTSSQILFDSLIPWKDIPRPRTRETPITNESVGAHQIPVVFEGLVGAPVTAFKSYPQIQQAQER
jgi:hypothetical protein